MKTLVTGAAGFIGSHLVSHLVEEGHDVWAIDSFTPYYPRTLKERNISFARESGEFLFEDRSVGELSASDLTGLDAVVHLAAQPGVRLSWADLDTYLDLNLAQTGKLAQAIIEAGVARVVFASSSSVYGDSVSYPTREDSVLTPRSPYGVTKLAGESLWAAYTQAAPELSVAALRFFTVYGPGQRPDMATQRLISAAIDGSHFTLFGTGEQRRDFTYVDDVVRACAKAMVATLPSTISRINIGGAGDTSMNRLIDLVADSVGNPPEIRREEAQKGDVFRTGADTGLAQRVLGWQPTVQIEEGVANHVRFSRLPTFDNWRTRN